MGLCFASRILETRHPSSHPRGRAHSVRCLDLRSRGVPNEPVGVSADLEPRDFHFSHYSLAHAEGGVCIDMTDGCVRFDWEYVPSCENPGLFATFARRLHFRNGHHVDEPARQIKVPRRPRTAS